ncbi:hypothetical protein RCF27_10220 [Rhodococcus pyridinivorans]|uniref:Uncharacterized protein n=1 Tax=Rhodococcus pyridinivorans TaxID=103816 RepID=A0A7M2XS53_9NOCA|nr:hypothetical protein [Rhodococcus pyridinivorans]QOW00616.1 hypothetical protein INP59_10025 [Rhodococcus pyridinivorans]WMM74620.1 hypothetical protein RCF27_10220 [Rhodococcus pyridinivorans]
MDVVALAAVVSSGLTSLAAIGYQAYGDRRRRAHDANQAFEGRAWEKKSESHYALIGTCRRISSALSEESLGIPAVEYLISTARRELAKIAPEIVAYGSNECLANLEAVEAMLGAMRDERGLLLEATEAHREKLASIEGAAFDAAAVARDREKKALEGLLVFSGLDQDTVRKKLQIAVDALTDSARSSVRASAI